MNRYKPKPVSAERDAVGAALTRRRELVLQKTYRELDADSKALAESKPELYDRVSHSTFNKMELQGKAFFDGKLDAKKLRTIIYLYYTDNMDQFVQETGVIPNFTTFVEHNQNPHDAPQAFLYQEGQVVTIGEILDGSLSVGVQPLAYPETHWLMKATSRAMEPNVFAGQTVAIRATAKAEPGEMVCIKKGAQGLILAWMLAKDVFCQNNPTDGRPSFKLSPSDSVIGVVSWITPRLEIPDV